MATIEQLESAMGKAAIAKRKADREFAILKIMIAVNYLLTLIILVILLT